MSRRVRLPTADDIFRPTAVPDPEPDPDADQASDYGLGGRAAVREAGDTVDRAEAASSQVVELPKPVPADNAEPRTHSGRVRHDEKMTVYVTADELLDLEHARLELRRHHRIAVDRGRLVRAAVALALADLDAHGAESALVRRLAGG